MSSRSTRRRRSASRGGRGRPGAVRTRPAARFHRYGLGTLRRGRFPAVDLAFRPCSSCPEEPRRDDPAHRPRPARRPRRRHRRQRRAGPRRLAATPPTQGADLVVFTELTITGYPPEDLLLKPEFVAPTSTRSTGSPPRARRHGRGRRLRRRGRPTRPTRRPRPLGRRARDPGPDQLAAVLADGEVVATYDKLRLPNYGVFDEARYFTPRDRPASSTSPASPSASPSARTCGPSRPRATPPPRRGRAVVANLNASPYHRGKRADRERGCATTRPPTASGRLLQRGRRPGRGRLRRRLDSS
jgi:hypothetical protein